MESRFERDGDIYKLIVERQLPHPPEKVWRALTERDLLKQWFPSDVLGSWEVGSPLKFVFEPGVMDDLPEEDLIGQVTLVEPPNRLEFTWGKYVITYELTEVEGGCVFRLTEGFGEPTGGARSAAGWEMCFDNLDLIIEGASAAKFLAEVFWAKFNAYKAQFEPEFGPQDGPPEGHGYLQDEPDGTPA